jgi:hypothetical protein
LAESSNSCVEDFLRACVLIRSLMLVDTGVCTMFTLTGKRSSTGVLNREYSGSVVDGVRNAGGCRHDDGVVSPAPGVTKSPGVDLGGGESLLVSASASSFRIR